MNGKTIVLSVSADPDGQMASIAAWSEAQQLIHLAEMLSEGVTAVVKNHWTQEIVSEKPEKYIYGKDYFLDVELTFPPEGSLVQVSTDEHKRLVELALMGLNSGETVSPEDEALVQKHLHSEEKSDV